MCLSFVSCNRAICMLSVFMKCVGYSIMFVIPSMVSCSIFMLCVLVSIVLLGDRYKGLFGAGSGGGWAGAGV